MYLYDCSSFFVVQAIVPIVFLFCRLWGSVRIIIHVAAPSDSIASSMASGWLQTMQAIFDPSMGFFNALIFVFMSKQDRDAFFGLIFSARMYRYFRSTDCCIFCIGEEKSSGNESAKEVGSRKRARYQGEDSELSISDYEITRKGASYNPHHFDQFDSSTSLFNN